MPRRQTFLVDTSVWLSFLIRDEYGYEEAKRFFLEA